MCPTAGLQQKVHVQRSAEAVCLSAARAADESGAAPAVNQLHNVHGAMLRRVHDMKDGYRA
ncbi:uncharacterized protein V6R79_020018 [Siganus canaliculatus]